MNVFMTFIFVFSWLCAKLCSDTFEILNTKYISTLEKARYKIETTQEGVRGLLSGILTTLYVYEDTIVVYDTW